MYENYAERFSIPQPVPNMNPSKTLFQLQGPASLQIVEEVLGEDIHDLQFNHVHQTTYNGHRMNIIRATVVKTPFNQHLSNKTFDTGSVPRLGE